MTENQTAAAMLEAEMDEAESWSKHGGISYMEARLTMARCALEDASLSEEAKTAALECFSKRAEAIRLAGYRKAANQSLVDILARAHSGVGFDDKEVEYRLYCSRASMQPDEGRLAKAREILAAERAERERLAAGMVK